MLREDLNINNSLFYLKNEQTRLGFIQAESVVNLGFFIFRSVS